MIDKDTGRKDTTGCDFSRIYMYICQNHEMTYKADEPEKKVKAYLLNQVMVNFKVELFN